MRDSSRYNHPLEPVRHSYPLTISDASFSTAVGLLVKTLPYVVVRFCVLVGVSVISIVWFGVTFGGAGFLGERIHPWVGYGWLFSGLGIYGWLWAFVVRYALYLIKCGHIAVLTELITTSAISNGSESMFSYGKRIVTERFAEVNVLFALDALVEGVVGAFNKTLDWVTSFLPIPGLHVIANLAGAIIRAATTYIDETIFSYNIARGEDNPWRGGRDGLVYYCQNNKEILKTAVVCIIADYVLTAIAWLLMFAPAALIVTVMPVLAGWSFLVALLFAINFRQAVLKPLFLTLIMIKFHVSVKGQAINEEWDQRLASLSPKFEKITSKIAGYVPSSMMKRHVPV